MPHISYHLNVVFTVIIAITISISESAHGQQGRGTKGAASLEAQAPATSITQLGGSHWIAKDSTGNSWVWKFMNDGRLGWAKIPDFYFKDDGSLDWDLNEHQTAFDLRGTWSQNGASVYMEFNRRFLEREGTIKNGEMKGTGRNVRGLRFAWTAQPYRPPANKPLKANRSQERNSPLSVRVHKIDGEHSLKIRAGFTLSTSGLDPQSETIRAKDGFMFVTIVFENKSNSSDYTLSMKDIELTGPTGDRVEAIDFFDPYNKTSLRGAKVGSPGNPANGLFGASFVAPTGGVDGLVLHVSRVEVGSIRELCDILGVSVPHIMVLLEKEATRSSATLPSLRVR